MSKSTLTSNLKQGASSCMSSLHDVTFPAITPLTCPLTTLPVNASGEPVSRMSLLMQTQTSQSTVNANLALLCPLPGVQQHPTAPPLSLPMLRAFHAVCYACSAPSSSSLRASSATGTCCTRRITCPPSRSAARTSA